MWNRNNRKCLPSGATEVTRNIAESGVKQQSSNSNQIEDTKGLIRCRKSKDGQQKNGQAMIYKTLHIKLMIGQTTVHGQTTGKLYL
jgi:hypothetical protein